MQKTLCLFVVDGWGFKRENQQATTWTLHGFICFGLFALFWPFWFFSLHLFYGLNANHFSPEMVASLSLWILFISIGGVWMILFRPVVYSPLYQYILPCLAVSNFYIVVSSRMNLELPVFDGFRCHYRLLRVQVKLISELFNGCLKEQLSVEGYALSLLFLFNLVHDYFSPRVNLIFVSMFWAWSIFYSNQP